MLLSRVDFDPATVRCVFLECDPRVHGLILTMASNIYIYRERVVIGVVRVNVSVTRTHASH